MNIKKQKGFIQIPLLIVIIVGVLVLGGGSYLSIKQYQNYQAKKIEAAKQVQEKEQLAQKLAQEEKEKTQKEKEKQEAEMTELKNKLTELENKPTPKPQIIYNTIEKTVEKTIEQSKERSIADVVKEWSPRVVYIFCEWRSDIMASGSGFLTVLSTGKPMVVTNKHVLKYQDIYTPEYCDIYFLNGEKYHALFSSQTFSDHVTYDMGVIYLSDLSTYLKELATVKGGSLFCFVHPEIGDKIVVLGYPAIGSNSGITVTEGIISGYEDAYFVTSAKIDHGNSGGIAVSVKDNCIVGMPSAAVSGEIESLGRILSYEAILSH